jgi:hypothetical protein
MGRAKLTAGQKSSGPVVLHLDRGVAHDLLLALTQALEPHSTGLKGKALKGKALKGRHLKAAGAKAKSSKGQSSAKPSPKGKSSKGKSSKRSR